MSKKQLSLLDLLSTLNIAKKYASAVRGIIDTHSIFLDGSCARGTATADSDIAVVMDEVPDDYLSTMALLWKMTHSVDDAIEPVLLTSEDDASRFLRTVQRTGIAI